jgi:ammonia channel protein AmtB
MFDPASVVAKECSVRSLDDNSWLLSSAMVVLSMQAGFAMLEVGAVQSTNGVNIMMKNMVRVKLLPCVCLLVL